MGCGVAGTGTLASLAGSPAGGRLWAPALVVRQEDTNPMGLQQQLLPIRPLSRPALEPCPLGLSHQAPPITGPGRPSLCRNSWLVHLLSLSPRLEPPLAGPVPGGAPSLRPRPPLCSGHRAVDYMRVNSSRSCFIAEFLKFEKTNKKHLKNIPQVSKAKCAGRE